MEKPPLRITSREVWVVLANTLALVVMLAILWKLRALVAWTLVALFLTLAAHPAMSWMTRHGVKRGWAVLFIFVAVLGLTATLVSTLIPIVLEQGRALATRAPDLLDNLKETALVQWADRHFQLADRVQRALRAGGADSTGPALAVAGSILHGIVGVITIVTLTLFMLLFGDEVFEKALVWVVPKRRAHWRGLAHRMRKVVGGYVLGTFLVASVGGVVMGLTTLFLGVPYFVALGLVMVVLGLIPYVGSVLGAIFVVGITFASAGLQAGLVALGVYLVYQQVENELLQPLVQRRTIRMNPLLISLVLLAGTMLAGIVGALLALPVAGALQVLLQDVQARREARWRRVNQRPGTQAHRSARHSFRRARTCNRPGSSPR